MKKLLIMLNVLITISVYSQTDSVNYKNLVGSWVTTDSSQDGAGVLKFIDSSGIVIQPRSLAWLGMSEIEGTYWIHYTSGRTYITFNLAVDNKVHTSSILVKLIDEKTLKFQKSTNNFNEGWLPAASETSKNSGILVKQVQKE